VPDLFLVGLLLSREEGEKKGKLFWIGGVVVLLLAVEVTMALPYVGEADYYSCVNNACGTFKMIGADETCNDNNEIRIV
jgi:hypothetical protein